MYEFGICTKKCCIIYFASPQDTKLRNIWFLSPLVPSKREKNILSFVKVNIDGSVLKKIYKLRQTKLSQFVHFSLRLRERKDTKTKYSAPHNFAISKWARVNPICRFDLPVQLSRSAKNIKHILKSSC